MSNSPASCYCTPMQEGGWEIICLTESSDSDYTQPTTTDDYSNFNTLPIGFSVKYEIGRHIEIVCDKSSVEYKPAMFQGNCSF